MAWTDEQIAGAGNWLRDNLSNPDLVKQEVARLGINQDDLLRAAQTQNQGITMGQVQQYMGAQPQQQPMQRQAPTMRGYEKNPYLDQMAQGIMQQQTRNLNEQILPGVRSQAIAAGGFGDARHGVAEGLAMGRTNDAIAREMANLYGTDYQKSMDRNAQLYQSEMQNQLGYAGLDTQRYGIDTGAATARYGTDANNATQRYGVDANNATQRYGIDQNYSLGQTNAANNRYGTDKQYEVGMAGANASLANAQANQALGQGQLALGQQNASTNLMLGLLDRQMAYNGAGIQMGTNIQNTPQGYYQQFTNSANSIGQGYGNSTQTQTGGGADALTGAAGLARIGQSWYNQSGGPVSDGGYSVGQGSAYAGDTSGGVFTPFRAGM